MESYLYSAGKKSLWVMTFLTLIIFSSGAVLWATPIFNPGTGHWYDIVSSGINGSWTNAENNAVALNGHLVTINDSIEEVWLLSTFGSDNIFWIGFNDMASEGNWVWSSGEAVTYTNWGPGEPNNSMPPPIGEDFAVLNWDKNVQWNDWDHERPGYFYIDGIAEFTQVSVPEPSTFILFSFSCLGFLGYDWRRKRS